MMEMIIMIILIWFVVVVLHGRRRLGRLALLPPRMDLLIRFISGMYLIWGLHIVSTKQVWIFLSYIYFCILVTRSTPLVHCGGCVCITGSCARTGAVTCGAVGYHYFSCIKNEATYRPLLTSWFDVTYVIRIEKHHDERYVDRRRCVVLVLYRM